MTNLEKRFANRPHWVPVSTFSLGLSLLIRSSCFRLIVHKYTEASQKRCPCLNSYKLNPSYHKHLTQTPSLTSLTTYWSNLVTVLRVNMPWLISLGHSIPIYSHFNKDSAAVKKLVYAFSNQLEHFSVDSGRTDGSSSNGVIDFNSWGFVISFCGEKI